MACGSCLKIRHRRLFCLSPALHQNHCKIVYGFNVNYMLLGNQLESLKPSDYNVTAFGLLSVQCTQKFVVSAKVFVGQQNQTTYGSATKVEICPPHFGDVYCFDQENGPKRSNITKYKTIQADTTVLTSPLYEAPTKAEILSQYQKNQPFFQSNFQFDFTQEVPK